MHVTGQCGHLGHRDLGVECGEALACVLFARDHLHSLGVQPQQACGQLLDGRDVRVGSVVPVHLRDRGWSGRVSRLSATALRLRGARRVVVPGRLLL